MVQDGDQDGGGIVWEVVGGVGKGGIVVRAAKDIGSSAASMRLSTGARVQEVDASDGRLRFRLLSGEGPEEGWVSIAVGGKALLAREGGECVDEADSIKDSDDLMSRYISSFGQSAKSGDFGFCRRAFQWLPEGGKKHTEDHSKPVEVVQAELALELGHAAEPAKRVTRGPTRPDGSSYYEPKETLCCRCRLPLGEMSYEVPGKASAGRAVGAGLCHGECVAQLMLLQMREEEEARLKEDEELKLQRRADYQIGWKAQQHIPRNMGPATKLACRAVPQGLCCLVLQEGSARSKSIRVAAALDPATAVNLEYLSLALQVRLIEGREPLFSLDPVEAGKRRCMQEKRFEPEWLAGTSLGEAMFQADYHLKELSMGEYEQPVLGMKTCADYSEEGRFEDKWNGREWFTVKNAEVRLTESNVLLPEVRMAVEAREQVFHRDGSLEDAPITRPNHPLVRYAEDFTKNFDLIAERKSVIYHLREAAKATVLAKFLLDSQVTLEDSWFSLAEAPSESCALEVPELWNERVHTKIHVSGGKIVVDDGSTTVVPMMHGVYGGVQFGLDKFSLSAGVAASAALRPAASRTGAMLSSAGVRPGILSTSPAATLQTKILASQAMTGVQRAPLSGLLAASSAVRPTPGLGALLRPAQASLISTATMRPQAAMLSAAATIRPQGVDLNLDKFSLSEVKRVPLEAKAGARVGYRPLDECSEMGNAFWAAFDGEAFKEEDKRVLRDVLNPHMCDRRLEGELFVPPDGRHAYVQRLRSLLDKEAAVRKDREQHFFSKHFVTDAPGPLFPSSWTSNFELEQGDKLVKVAQGRPHPSLFQERPDYKAQAALLTDVLKGTTPEFEKRAEDGMVFRIYRSGSLEVRTTQKHEEPETVGVVYSIRPTAAPAQPALALGRGLVAATAAARRIGDDQKVAKVTHYVERTPLQERSQQPPQHRCFTVFETEARDAILVELLEDGAAVWQEAPKDLQDRCSLAKVLRTADCKKDITVRDLKGHFAKWHREYASQTAIPRPVCKTFAQDFYNVAVAKSGEKKTYADSINVPQALSKRYWRPEAGAKTSMITATAIPRPGGRYRRNA